MKNKRQDRSLKVIIFSWLLSLGFLGLLTWAFFIWPHSIASTPQTDPEGLNKILTILFSAGLGIIIVPIALLVLTTALALAYFVTTSGDHDKV